MDDRPIVLDASALLALLNDEAGAAAVAALLPRVSMCAVNLAEVVGKLAEHGMPEPAIRSAVDALGIAVVGFGHEKAYQCGMLRPNTKRLGLSLGDRACIALGREISARVVTADRTWAQLEESVDVEVIRR